MESTVNRRVGWIDSLRGVAIILIVLGHSFRAEPPVESWVYACHVPLFLLIAGMVFSPRGSFREFARRRAATILIPYFTFALISIAIYAVLGRYAEEAVENTKSGITLGRNLLGMLWGNAKGDALRWNRPLWFLPMFFAMELIGYWAFRPSNSRAILAEMVCCAAFAWLLQDRLTRQNLPWDLETLPLLFPLFALGNLLRRAARASNRPRLPRRWRAIGGGLLVAAGALLVPLNGRIKYSADVYGNYGLFLLVAALLACGLALLATLLPDGVPALNRVGRSTTGILVMHKFPIMLFVVVPATRAALDAHPIAGPLLGSVVALGMCMPAIEVLRRIAPWSIGLRRVSTAPKSAK